MTYKNKIIIYILITSFTLIGCEKKQTPQIDLKEFLPLDSNATKYIYKVITVNEAPNGEKLKSKDRYEEMIVTSKSNNCVNLDYYMVFDKQDESQMPDSMKQQIKDGKLKNGSTQLCANNKKIFYQGDPILYQHNKDWTMKVQSFSASGKERTIEAHCEFILRSHDTILNKERKVIHTQCKYESDEGIDSKIDWFLAKELGLYKTIMTMDDKNTNSHSTITTSLNRYQ